MIFYTLSSILLFLLLTFIVYFLPGDSIVKRYKLKTFDHIIVSVLLGFIMWAWQAWIFGWLSVRFLSYLYLVAFFVYWIKTKRVQVLATMLKKAKPDWILIVLILLGTLNVLHNGFFNHITVGDDLIFFSAHPPDQKWHAALTHALKQNIPPEQPVMSGTYVVNYHYWGNMTAGELARVFSMPSAFSLFSFSSLFLGIMLGFGGYSLGRILKLNTLARYLLVVFLYFGGDVLPFINLLLNNGFSFTMGAMETGSALLMNYPRAFAVVATLVGLVFFVLWLKDKKTTTGLIMALALSSTFGFKANFGVFFTFGLASLGVYFLLTRKWRMILPLFAFLGFSALIFFPVNSGAGGLVFTGFWRTRDFIVHPELNLSHLELARQVFAEDGKWVKALAYDLLFLALFIVGVFGTKLVGLIQTKTSMKQLPKELHIVLITGSIVSLILGLFFIQESGGANSFNFISVVIIIMSVYAAISLDFFREKLPAKLFIVVLAFTLFMTIPRSMYESITHYRLLATGQYDKLNKEAQNYLTFINTHTNPQDTILTGDYFVSYIADRSVFLGTGIAYNILHTHAIDTSKRDAIVNSITTSYEATTAGKLLEANNIDILLEAPSATDSSEYLVEVSAPPFTLYRVDHDKLNNYLSDHGIIQELEL